ncbi:MetQ/NlpA family ABC transporter substrate-binding protein [Sporosarcina sp. G11-34]|uniref:MetQ/NlpA family ABC transporter substrate-binding protein n=1 Tax=Sporosarcina sp. G11-34 TaxID=2849605 RepID=UPI0022A93141|nr:MetQ/NlpA family ABC transporter substrate-binding protein [Sporosarcina sp. G11-34]MCZ2260476.1 methionine ABC transporter substrate-binding protein [Sporosarcina sp. G11-34]
MKRILLIALLAFGALALVACGAAEKDKEDTGSGDAKEKTEDVKLVVGASNTPHALILEEAKPLLKEKGIDLVIEQYTEFIFPNQDLESGTLDANYFQHAPYLNAQIKDHGYKFVNAGSIHIEPIGVYSKKYQSIDELPDGAVILMSNSITDHGRILAMLEIEGLITLDEKVEKTAAEVKDIIENPKNLVFEADYDPALMPELYKQDEGDALLINSNFAIDAGLDPINDSIVLEDTDSPYANIITVREGDEDNAEIKTLLAVLRSKEIQDFILKEWDGSIVPVK